jgi:hypothetical protein
VSELPSLISFFKHNELAGNYLQNAEQEFSMKNQELRGFDRERGGLTGCY